MLKLKSLKKKLLESSSTDSHVTGHVLPDESHVTLLSQWLEQLNREQLVAITDQNDIVVMPGGKDDPAQQIFVNHDDVHNYMDTVSDETSIMRMIDIARILLLFGYVKEASGQLSFEAQGMKFNRHGLLWLTSIIRNVHINSKTYETDVSLCDAEHAQLLSIPYEHMTPTENVRTVADYLFQNGHIRYDVDTRSYAYRYIEPDVLLDEKTKSPERVRQHHQLSFHIRRIHVDKLKKRIEVEFVHEPNRRLLLPAHWYYRVHMHDFDRDYIIDALLAHGGLVDQNNFTFLDEVYALRESYQAPTATRHTSSSAMKMVNLSVRQKHDLIRHYIDLIIENDSARQDKTAGVFAVANPSDGRYLYFTSTHSQFIRQNHFRRQDVIQILFRDGQIKQDESGDWFLFYNHQYIRLPQFLIPSSTVSLQNHRQHPSHKESSFSLQEIPRSLAAVGGDNETGAFEQYHSIIDYMCRHGLVTWDKQSKLIRLHFADQTLLLPLSHLRTILDPRVISSAAIATDVLPFSSRQLSQWLLNNACLEHDAN